MTKMRVAPTITLTDDERMELTKLGKRPVNPS
jgi:hypothetical protein